MEELLTDVLTKVKVGNLWIMFTNKAGDQMHLNYYDDRIGKYRKEEERYSFSAYPKRVTGRDVYDVYTIKKGFDKEEFFLTEESAKERLEKWIHENGGIAAIWYA